MVLFPRSRRSRTRAGDPPPMNVVRFVASVLHLSLVIPPISGKGPVSESRPASVSWNLLRQWPATCPREGC